MNVNAIYFRIKLLNEKCNAHRDSEGLAKNLLMRALRC